MNTDNYTIDGEANPEHDLEKCPMLDGHDCKKAEIYLTLLDEAADTFTFQTFNDNKDRQDRSLARILNGTLEEHYKTLVALNKKGAGIFVTVNRTDGKGRTTENITAVRALWQDADRGDEPQLPIVPHIVVESSPGKYHRYILVDGAPLDEFTAVQQRLVDDYGSDSNAKDLPRVLRLPGFYHMKDPRNPHLVRIIDKSNERPYSWEYVKKAFPPVPCTKPLAGLGLPESDRPLANLAEVASALEALDPDLGYQDWLNVGMALHSTGEGHVALELWDSWSRKGKKYLEGDCMDRWSTFQEDGGITIRTLYHMARVAGWNGQVTASDEIKPLVKNQTLAKLEEFNDRHGVVMVNGQAMYVYRERDGNTGRMTTRFSRQADLRVRYQPETVMSVSNNGANGQKVERKPLFDVWNSWDGRRTYDQLVFKPKSGLIAGDQILPDGPHLNLYQGLDIVPQKGDCSLTLKHIREIWCDGRDAAYEYVIGWLARMIQRPGERGHTVLVLRSGQGTGKNIIVDILIDAFGEHATVAVKPDDLTGRFNDHLGTSVLVFANEAIWGGRKEQEGILKSLVTDKELPVERKYLPKYRVPNCCHLIMASNNDWVAPVDLDDRRFVILDVSEARKGDQAYFDALSREISNGGAQAFIHYLMHYDISSFEPRTLPELGIDQATKRDAIVRGLNSVDAWWLECLDAGSISLGWLTSGYAFQTRPNLALNWESEGLEIEKTELYEAYCAWAQKHRRHSEQANTFGKKLKELTKATVSRPVRNGDRPRCYKMPDLMECRRSWEQRARIPWDWGEDLPEMDAQTEGQSSDKTGQVLEFKAPDDRSRRVPRRIEEEAA